MLIISIIVAPFVGIPQLESRRDYLDSKFLHQKKKKKAESFERNDCK